MVKQQQYLNLEEPVVVYNVPPIAPQPTTPIAQGFNDKPSTQTLLVPTKNGNVTVVTPVVKNSPLNLVEVNEAGNPINNQNLDDVIVKSTKQQPQTVSLYNLAANIIVSATGLFLLIFLGKKIYNYLKKSSKKSRR